MLKGPAPFDQGLFLMHLHKGKEYFDQNQIQKAREELEAAYHLRPQDEKVLNMLGMTYFKLEMLPQAEEMYVALSSNNPDIYTLQSNLGLIRLKLEKLDQAKDSLARALELQPGNPKAHFYLGLLYEKRGEWEQALHHFQQAKADKMVAKMSEKIEEEKREQEILPFLVMEVLSEEQPVLQQAAMAEQGPQPWLTAAEQQMQWSPPESNTEKMRKQDLAEAVARVEGEASGLSSETSIAEDPFVKEEEPATESSWNDSGQDTERLEFQDVIESAQKQPAIPEEIELVEDSTPEVPHGLEEGRIEEEKEDFSPWEKTQPKVIIPEASESFSQTVTDSQASSLDSSFLIAEEMAADISTFLAQSREESSSLFSEETTPQVPSPEEILQSGGNEEDLFESRLPTPEEVENTTRDFGDEMIFEKPGSDVPPEEERVAAELTEDQRLAEEESAEEEAIQEGHLEPSPITPLVQDSVVEFTQEMLMEKPVEEPPAAVTATPEPSASPVPESQPPVQEPELELPAKTYQPANLDQFSRDRFYVQPLIGADRFLLIDPHLLEIVISEKLVCRIGTISSYTGNLQFTPWQSELKDRIPFIQVSGSGVVFLADRRKEIFIVSLNHETMFVEANHLLVVQSALKVEPHLFQQRGARPGVSMVKVSGRGTLALTCQTKPLTLNVYEALPVSIPADALIAWSGKLSANEIVDENLRKVMMTSEEETVFLRFAGSGDVVVEQGGLWGDRRSKR